MSKKTMRLLIIFMSIILVFLVLSLAVQIIILPQIKHETTELIIEQFIGSDTSASDVLEQMDQEDIETIEEIVSKSISSSDFSTISKYVANHDIDSIKKYANDKLTESDKQKYRIYTKNINTLNN